MMINDLTLHETLDVHELVTMKNNSLTKSVMMSKLVQDPELKTILESDVTTGTLHIDQLQKLLTKREEEV